MRYIRQRSNGNWQCRIYTDNTKFSFTSPDLEKVVQRRNNELGYNPDEEKREPKILIFDIETAPILAWVWGIRDQYIAVNQIEKDWYLLSFAYRWLGQETKVLGLNDFPNYQKENDCEKDLVTALWDLLNEADIIIAHNAKRFDVAKVNSRILFHDIPEPTPYKVVDTLRMARQNFGFTSNKLEYLAKYKGAAQKLDNEGMPLWIGCVKGYKKSWDAMKQYNKGDIDSLENIYLELRGWDKNHPNLQHYYNDNLTRCTNCGEPCLEPTDEDMLTTTQSYSGYRCTNCGHFMRGRKNNTNKEKEILTSAR